MKTLIVYYSLTKNCYHIAQLIQKSTRADVLRLETQKAYDKVGLWQIFHLGMFAGRKKQMPLKPWNINLDEYDTLIIGTPIWAWTLTPPIRTFLTQEKAKLQAKKVALFCCYGGNYKNTFAELKELMPGNEFLDEIAFKEPHKNKDPKAEKQVNDWLTKIGLKQN